MARLRAGIKSVHRTAVARLRALLTRWQQEIEGKEFSDVLDIAKYGDRVIGIGEFEKYPLHG